MIGKTVSHYRILEKLGGGGMGVVYKAEDTKLKRTVALKFLPEELSKDRQALERFQREAQAASALNHPNICTIHAIEEHEGQPFIDMEYLEGQTLKHRIAWGKPLRRTNCSTSPSRSPTLSTPRTPRASSIGTSSQRIFSSPRVARRRSWTLAWPSWRRNPGGLAETVGALRATAARARAPHQPGRGDGNGRIHVAGAGARRRTRRDGRTCSALAWCCTRWRRVTLPFPGQLPRSSLTRSCTKAPTSPVRLNPDCPAELERIINKALEKDRDLRYQSAGEIRADLKRLKRDTESGRAVAPVEPVAPVSTPAARAAVRTLPLQNRWIVAASAAAIVALLAVLIAFNVSGLRDGLLTSVGARHGVSTPEIESIAVLPLENLSRDPEQEYFADGMTEELIATLGKLGALRVISRTSVMRYKKTDKPLPQIAKELNVDAVIEGSVLQAGNRVRITAQLIQGSTDRHLWAETYDRDLRDVLALQGEVARAIASQIKTEVAPQEQVRLASHRPVNPEAYALYVRGKMFAAPDNKAAIEMLERAVSIDPNFAPAYAALGRAYSDRLFYLEPKDQWKEKAEAAVEKALSLDPNLAEAHVSRAPLLWTPANGWQHEKAIQECKRALALDASLDQAHVMLAEVFSHVGLLDEALQELQTATAINPTLPEDRCHRCGPSV